MILKKVLPKSYTPPPRYLRDDLCRMATAFKMVKGVAIIGTNVTKK